MTARLASSTMNMAGSSKPTPSLRRELGLTDAVAVGFGAIIGAGIFVVSGVAAGVAGPSFLLGLVVAVIVATFNALSSAQLAARYPTSGGTYEYGYQVLHPWAGFSAGWTFLASKIAAGGTVAIGFGGYLAQLLPGVSAKGAAVLAVALLTAANCLGIKKAGKLNFVIVAITLASLTCFVGMTATSFNAQYLTPFAPNGYGATLQSAAILFFAYTGYARIATLAEEVRDPETTIPKAILISLGATALLYLLVTVAAVGAVGSDSLSQSRSPLAQVATIIGSPFLEFVIGIGATTAMLGVLLSQVLGISRVMLAMSRRNDMPGFVGHVSEQFGVPDRAILLTGVAIALLAIFGTLEWVISAATFTILLYYTITNAAALKMAKDDKKYPELIAWMGMVCCLILAFSLRTETILSGLGLLLIGFAFRSILKLVKARAGAAS